MSRNRQKQGTHDGVQVVEGVIVHRFPDIEAGLMYVLMSLALVSSRFRVVLDRRGTLPVRFIPAGKLRAADWSEFRDGCPTPARIARELKMVGLDAGGGPLDQHVLEGTDMSSLRLLLDHVGWRAAGPYGYLEPLFEIISSNDTKATDVASLEERAESREDNTVSRTLRSYVQTICRHGEDKDALLFMDIAFRAIILKMERLARAGQPADQAAVREMLTRAGLFDVVESHCPSEDNVGWFVSVMAWAEEQMFLDWAWSENQAWEEKDSRGRPIVGLAALDVPRIVRNGGKVVVANVRGDLAEEGPAPFISRVARRGNRDGAKRKAEQMAIGDWVLGESGAVTSISRTDDGQVHLTWTGADGSLVERLYASDERIVLQRPYPKKPPRAPASAVLVHHPGGRFTLTWIGTRAATTGLAATVAAELRLADLATTRVVIRPGREDRCWEVLSPSDEHRSAILAGLRRFGRCEEVGLNHRLGTVAVRLPASAQPELLVRTVTQVVGSTEGLKSVRVILADAETLKQLRRTGQPVVPVSGLDDRGRFVRGEVEANFHLTPWGGVGNAFTSNPDAAPTLVSPEANLEIVLWTIEREAPKIADQLAVTARAAAEGKKPAAEFYPSRRAQLPDRPETGRNPVRPAAAERSIEPLDLEEAFAELACDDRSAPPSDESAVEVSLVAAFAAIADGK